MICAESQFCPRLAAHLPLCAPPKLASAFFRGVRSMFIDFRKELLFQAKCHGDKVTVGLNELLR